MKKLLLLVLLTFWKISMAGPHYVSGEIANVTVTKSGMMFQFKGAALPDNCEGSSYGWMFIKQEDTTMISVFIASWMAGKLKAKVFSSGLNSSGVCEINQFDPTYL